MCEGDFFIGLYCTGGKWVHQPTKYSFYGVLKNDALRLTLLTELCSTKGKKGLSTPKDFSYCSLKNGAR